MSCCFCNFIVKKPALGINLYKKQEQPYPAWHERMSSGFNFPSIFSHSARDSFLPLNVLTVGKSEKYGSEDVYQQYFLTAGIRLRL